MKKLTLLIMPLMTLSFLASCGGNKPGPTPPEPTKYTLTINCTNCTPFGNESSYEAGANVSFIITPKDTYVLPKDIEVTGVTDYEYTLASKEVATFACTMPANPVSVTVTATKPTHGGLCLTSKEDNSTVAYSADGVPNINIEISYDENTWADWNGETITLDNDEKIYIRNTKDTLSTGLSDYFSFDMTGKIAASGNMMSMINYADLSERCFYQCFKNCASLISAPELPATKLAPSCYMSMFETCTSLTVAPELPATTLASGCYRSMFSICSNLVTPPSLPASTLVDSCYASMFSQCSKLVTPPSLPATTLADECYRSMFLSCHSLASAPKLSATKLAPRCYYWMFDGCTALKVRENDSTDGTLIFTYRDDAGVDEPVDDMFNNTGGTFTGTPTAGNTYYWY